MLTERVELQVLLWVRSHVEELRLAVTPEDWAVVSVTDPGWPLLAVPVMVEEPEPPGWTWMEMGLEDSVANVGVPFAKLPGWISSGSANPEKSTIVTHAPFWTLV